MKEYESVLAVAGCLGFIPAAVIGFILRGWVIVTLWGWFVTPVFGIHPPSYAMALGLGVVGSMLTGEKSSGPSNKHETLSDAMISTYSSVLLCPVLSVAFGWIVRCWA